MSSSSGRQMKLFSPVGPVRASATQAMKSSWSMEDSKKKVTVTNETIHKNNVVTDHRGRVGLKQEVVNKTTERVKDKITGTIREKTHEVVTKNGVVHGKEEKGKARPVIKDNKHGSSHHSHQKPRETIEYKSREKHYRHVK